MLWSYYLSTLIFGLILCTDDSLLAVPPLNVSWLSPLGVLLLSSIRPYFLTGFFLPNLPPCWLKPVWSCLKRLCMSMWLLAPLTLGVSWFKARLCRAGRALLLSIGTDSLGVLSLSNGCSSRNLWQQLRKLYIRFYYIVLLLLINKQEDVFWMTVKQSK